MVREVLVIATEQGVPPLSPVFVQIAQEMGGLNFSDKGRTDMA
jgi:hypothetical protein